MKFAAGLLLLVVVCPAFAETPALVAKMSSLSTSQCHRSSSTYEIRIGGSFELQNQSKNTVLVAKKIDMVLAVFAALSADAAYQRKYTFVMNQEFGGNTGKAPPQLEDFVVLKPGGKGLVQMDSIVSADTTMEHAAVNHLRPGRYWFQFQFSTIPLSFPAGKDFNAWREKWKAKGTLTNAHFITKPFPVDLTLDADSEACGSK